MSENMRDVFLHFLRAVGFGGGAQAGCSKKINRDLGQ